MKANHVRSLLSRSAIFATPAAALVLGFCLQACGGAPDGEPGQQTAEEKTGQSAQDLSIFGIPVPQPTVTIGLGDNSATIDPVGTIDNLVPDAGISIPDPLKPVENIVTALGNPISVGVNVGDLGVSLKAPPLVPPELSALLNSLDPFSDGGIPVIGK
ncbi:MAG TPA: hypothetical protein VHV30_08585 [Polyangiaceae bacterium]|jgi:hypothetical protein|nr:hypothetical protein [Polyangiaceae bacterium]